VNEEQKQRMGDKIEKYNMSYGGVILGRGNVMFIVPHGYNGDEKGIHELIGEVCFKTSSSAVVNAKVPRKEINLNNLYSIERAELSIGREFFADCARLISEVADSDKQTFVFSAHLCPRVFTKDRLLYLAGENPSSFLLMKTGEPRPYQIDLGAGVIETASARNRVDLTEADLEKIFLPVTQVRPDIKNPGRVICERRDLLKIKRSFQAAGFDVTVGLEWPAGCRYNLLQALHEMLPAVNFIQLECVAESAEELVKLKDSLIELTIKLTQ